MGSEGTHEQGRWIFAAWKHLRRYDSSAMGRMGATAAAGRAGDLLGRLRRLTRYEYGPLKQLAQDADLAQFELKTVIIPRLEAVGGLHVERDVSGEIVAVLPLVLTETDVFTTTAACWKTLEPGAEEAGALEILRVCSEIPRTREELLVRCVSAGATEDEAARAVELACAVNLVKRRHVADLETDLYYNEYLWGHSIARTAEAIGHLQSDTKEALVSVLDELHRNEGRPLDKIQSADPKLIKLASESGLVERTEIQTRDGKSAAFLFTPRLKGFGVAKEDIPDELEQIRLVIASFQFAQYFASNRLEDPVWFLSSLIERGRGGSAEPIGTDYGALQKQQIVTTQPIFRGARNHEFLVIKEDSLVSARDAMQAGEVTHQNQSTGASLLDSRAFLGPVDTRIAMGRQAGPSPLQDDRLLAAVREAAQGGRPRPGQ